MNRYAILTVFLLAASVNVLAQSSVTIFGNVDNGVTYSSNVLGHSRVAMQDGANRVNKLGFSGVEDLGDGRSAIFDLRTGFSVNTGTLSSGLMFTQTDVGLKDEKIGSFTMGRQYDFTVNLEQYMPCLSCGIYIFQNSDLDRLAGEMLANSVMFQSAKFGGFSANAMYAFAQNAGSQTTNAGRAISASLKYENGPVSAMAVYTDINGAPIHPGTIGVSDILGVPAMPIPTLIVGKQRIVGLGALYKFGALTPSVLYTNTRLEDGGKSATNQIFHIGATYFVTPALILAGKFAVDRFEESRWYSFNLGLDYFLSKRTDVYVEVAAQKATGEGAVASFVTIGPSSTDKQLVSRVGIKHVF